jgi:hypothetical protein
MPPVPEQLSRTIETLYRSESGRVLSTLVRLLGDLDLAEEAMHEAFAAAAGSQQRRHVQIYGMPFIRQGCCWHLMVSTGGQPAPEPGPVFDSAGIRNTAGARPSRTLRRAGTTNAWQWFVRQELRRRYSLSRLWWKANIVRKGGHPPAPGPFFPGLGPDSGGT